MADEDEPYDDEEENEDEDEEKGQTIIDPESLPDGNRTVIVGDWSQAKTIGEGLTLCKDGDILYCNGGVYDEALDIKMNNLEVSGPPDLSCVINQGVSSRSVFSSISKLSIKNGIEVHCGNLRILECHISDAEKGLRIHQMANPYVSGCTFQGIKRFNICVHPGGLGTLEKNVITGSETRGEIGLYMDNCGETVFKKNVIQKTMTGIYAMNGCRAAKVEDNVIQDVTAHGIYLDMGAKPNFDRNEVLSSGHYAVLASGESTGVFQKNIFHASIRIHKGSRPSFFENMVVIPSEVINDDKVFALHGLALKRLEDLPKKKKEKPPDEEEEEGEE